MRTATVAALIAALVVTFGPPAHASAVVFQGCVTQGEYVQTRQGMTKRKIERRIYGVKKKRVLGFVTDRAPGRKTIAYRVCPKRWEVTQSGVGVEYHRIGGKWRVVEATGIFTPKGIAA